jgi:hypothetical protein
MGLGSKGSEKGEATETGVGCTVLVEALNANVTVLASTPHGISRSAILESWDWARSSGRRAP